MRLGKFKNIFFVIAGIVALFVAYSFFVVGDSSESPVLVSQNEQSGRVPQSAIELLRVLNDLQRITLDSRFFSDEGYRSLRDWSVRLVPEPEGRVNPFAPF